MLLVVGPSVWLLADVVLVLPLTPIAQPKLASMLVISISCHPVYWGFIDRFSIFNCFPSYSWVNAHLGLCLPSRYIFFWSLHMVSNKALGIPMVIYNRQDYPFFNSKSEGRIIIRVPGVLWDKYKYKKKETSSLFQRVMAARLSINFDGTSSLPNIEQHYSRTSREADKIEKQPYSLNINQTKGPRTKNKAWKANEATAQQKSVEFES